MKEVERRGEERRGDYLPKIDGRDVLNPTDEPNMAHVESSGWGKTRPDFFKPAQWFGTTIVPSKTPHDMTECSGWPLI